jgi:vitamin B12 transporter
MKKSICIAGCAFSILAAATNCLALDGDSETSTTTMKKVVVTATKTVSPSGQIGGSSVTVISSEEIKAKQQTTVEEILKGVPGLDIVANGGAGTTTSVFLRGADSKNTLILIDGVMLNDPSNSTRSASLGNLNVDNIERIEVVRGPQSVLYGSNATAGVINIITKKGTGKRTIYAGTEGGSYGTWKASAGSSGAINNINYSLTVSHTKTDGFSTANDDNDRIPHAGNTSENDGWENTTLTGKFDVTITPDFDISAIIRYLDSDVELDESGDGYIGDRFNYPDWPLPPIPEPNGLKEMRSESEQILGKFSVHNFFFNKTLESNLYYQAS